MQNPQAGTRLLCLLPAPPVFYPLSILQSEQGVFASFAVYLAYIEYSDIMYSVRLYLWEGRYEGLYVLTGGIVQMAAASS